MTFEIDEYSEPPVVQARPMVPSLWQAGNGLYKDMSLENYEDTFTMVYDYPRKRTDRNHLVRKGAMMFIKSKTKSKKGWRLAGRVMKVVSVGYYPENPQQKYAELLIQKMLSTPYSNKNEVIGRLGFRPLSDNERMHGLIPLYLK